MKTSLQLIAILFVLAGCQPIKPEPVTKVSRAPWVNDPPESTEVEPTPVRNKDVFEYCYQGVTYVRFGYSDGAWGSVKMGRDGRIVLCGAPHD